jgi:hypothetical protein
VTDSTQQSRVRVNLGDRAETPAAPAHPDPVQHHWIMTVQTTDGRQATSDGPIDVIPGMHTHETSYKAVRKSVAAWVGTNEFSVLFFSLTPNQL